ncbi:MAG: 4-hydroxy-3-methylbut-2-enyl diphosphate reductase [Pyramidobacter porci]|uniref:4-hydroxy-3-methylbut-2-enyl diphosphate reductase n=1 Tax=Pyramidobacter porci TaxID=2605789 RepID=UPI002A759C5B|nr:4-hydroxy-3-methylbut-2-enyl diphosphate reductase [Pyramidobacter porci]MCI6261026.1 4-hydroxy-3-methylbut-2-enyl diphosphate reductase [Pyramidobacter sp.]MDY2648768.1 4-hydroxy-3-methylbut-2-enyl diphosphate reductase [Pyramidobacter porci]
MKVLVAAPTGLCFGVKRAIGFVEKALTQAAPVYALGSPIHNPQEVERLQKMGLCVVQSEMEIPAGAAAFIRAHGAAPGVLENLRKRNVNVIDGTCPFVRAAQNYARELSEAGYHVLILGNEKHPEIIGMRGYVRGPSTVISTIPSLFSSTIFKSSVKIHKLGLVSQTTQEESLLAEVAKAALGVADELRIYNTICRATIERQQAVRRLASAVDGMIVIGGHNSANTGKLCRIARDSNCDAVWIEHAGQLDRRWVLEKRVIGIAAGASTPDWLIEQLHNAIDNIAGRQGDVRNE